MIKTILVGLGDLPYSESATHHALQLAQTHDATLTAVTLLDLPRLEATGPVPVGGGPAAKQLRAYRLQRTQEIVEAATEHFEQACRKAGVRFGVLHEQGDPFGRMTDCVRYHDLVVCGLETLFEHGVIDEPSRELIQLIERGVRPVVAVTAEPRDIGRVLIAYSGSTESANTMKRFLQMELWPDLTLRIVSFNRSDQQSHQLLADAANYCRRHGYDPEVDHVVGSPAEQLVPYASQWNADLIVMGSSARKFRIRKLVGKTAQRVIISTDLPLFLCQ